jgi:hypothetical protein
MRSGGELFLLDVVPEILSRWSDVIDTMFIEASLSVSPRRALT